MRNLMFSTNFFHFPRSWTQAILVFDLQLADVLFGVIHPSVLGNRNEYQEYFVGVNVAGA